MTTIIFLESSIPLPGIHDGTDRLINYHVQAVQARFQRELEERIAMLSANGMKLTETLTGHWPYPEYLAAVKSLDAVHPFWSVYDHRLVFFLAEFAGLVKEAKVIWIDRRSKTEYEKALNKLCKKVFDAFDGPKLRLTEGKLEEVIAFIKDEISQAPALNDLPTLTEKAE